MIEDLKEGKAQLDCLITKADIGRTAKNVPYLNLTLEDASGVLDAKFWNLSEEVAESFHPGDIVDVKGDLIYHRNAAQLRVRTMHIKPDGRLSDYVRQSPMKREEMEAEIDAMIEQMTNPIIKDITKELLNLNREAFFTFPAAVRNHHNFVGGLAFHTLSMARLAQAVLPFYPFLHADLMMAGILLHDMGKIEELSHPVLPEYTPAGNLIGHISMMNNQIDRIAVLLGEENSEEVTLLKHMVLSHHGKLEYGSPVLPMIPEAEMLTLIDNMDARMVMMKNAIDATVPGTFGPRVFALDNRMLYRRVFDTPAANPQPESSDASDQPAAEEAAPAAPVQNKETGPVEPDRAAAHSRPLTEKEPA